MFFLNNLKIEKESKKVYDIQYVSKPVLFLKGIGRTCPICGNHVTGHPNKKYCSEKCSNKNNNNKNHKDKEILVGLHSFISLKVQGGSKPYRILKVYLKKGIIHQVKITPESKELWSLLDKITEFRDIKKPLMELTV